MICKVVSVCLSHKWSFGLWSRSADLCAPKIGRYDFYLEHPSLLSIPIPFEPFLIPSSLFMTIIHLKHCSFSSHSFLRGSIAEKTSHEDPKNRGFWMQAQGHHRHPSMYSKHIVLVLFQVHRLPKMMTESIIYQYDSTNSCNSHDSMRVSRRIWCKKSEKKRGTFAPFATQPLAGSWQITNSIRFIVLIDNSHDQHMVRCFTSHNYDWGKKVADLVALRTKKMFPVAVVKRSGRCVSRKINHAHYFFFSPLFRFGANCNLSTWNRSRNNSR